jgi:hypothetical protein
MDLEHMTDKEKEALHITYVSESDLIIRGKWKTIELIKYSDGDVEFEMTDGRERITYIFDKAQIEFLAKWLTHSR